MCRQPNPSSRSATSRPTTGRSWRSAASPSRCPQGGIVTILGANGAGKTTVLKTVCGVMDPQKGSVEFEGREIQRHGPRQGDAARHEPRAGGPRGLPVPVACARTCAWAPTRARDPDGVAQDLETVFGYFPVLKERAEQRAGSLSGGEQQMLSISRALMARPQLMLLDEPRLGPVARSWSRTSSRSSCASTASAASPSCWSSRTPTWRCRRRRLRLCAGESAAS